MTNLKFQHSNQNIIFQKSSYKNRPITLGPKSLKLLCLDLWGAKGAGDPPLSMLQTFYRQRVLVALRCVQMISILKRADTVDEGSYRLGILSGGPPLSVFDMLLATRGVLRT